MTYEEARNVMSALFWSYVPARADGKSGQTLMFMQALDKTIDALEKQIPKKPYWEYGGYHCKSCGLDISEDDAYCPLCGQRIDWRDYE